MANVSSNWQDVLDHKLVNRLTRPLHQPSMTNMGMSRQIINRCDHFLNRLPLLSQQMQRWGNTNTRSSDSVPIVYAQARARESTEQNVQPLVSQNKPSTPLIQRKVDSAQALPVQTDSSTDLPNSSFLEETPSTSEQISVINQNSDSTTELPLVSPSTISDQLESREQLPLQAKLPESQEVPADSSPLNPPPRNSDLRSHLDGVSSINQKSDSTTELPLVSPSTISDQLESREQLPLQAKLPESQEVPADSSPLNPPPRNSDLRSHLDEVTSINPTATSTSELPLVQELTSTSPQPLPIIQAKQQNSTPSPTSVPIVNPLNTLITPKQTQKNYQNSSYQNIEPLPIVFATSPQVNSSSQTRSLPLSLVNNSPLSNSTSQKPSLSSQNSRVSNANASSSPKIFASSLPPTQTFVSAKETKPQIDLDAISSKVERKIMRRLVIESERRGKIR